MSWELRWEDAEWLDDGLCRWSVPSGWIVAAYTEHSYRTIANPNEENTDRTVTALCFVPEKGTSLSDPLGPK